MSECQHDAVMTYSGVGAGRMWACEDCQLRLYPACRECVVDGHRNGEHPAAPSPALTREALAAAFTVAFRKAYSGRDPVSAEWWADAILSALEERNGQTTD